MRAWAWAAALFALTAWLGRLDLLDPDEARHAEVAREMLASGRWLTPVLHGEPYYDKPAAFYWLLAASMRVFGENAWAARLPCAAAALWTVLVTARFTRRAYSDEAATFVIAGLATTCAFVVLGRTVVVDMPFTAALTTACAWLGAWRLDTPGARRTILPFYVALGAACLLKGPVALALGGMVAAATVIVARDWTMARALRPLNGAAVVLAVTAPWYAAAWLADPAYLREFVLRHNVERYLRPIGAGHLEPWWYYLVALPVILLPWTPLVAAAVVERLRRGARNDADLYCATWAAAVLAFFAPASTKLATYLIPALPPLACLTAAALARHARAQVERDEPVQRGDAQHMRRAGRNTSASGVHAIGALRLAAVHAVAWTAFVVVAVVAAAAYVLAHSGATSFVALASALAALGALGVARRARRSGAVRASLAAVALGSLVLVSVTYTLVADHVDALRDARSAAAIVRRATRRSGELVAYRCVPHAVAFYSQRAAARTREPQRALAALAPSRPGALLTEKKRIAELGLEPPPPGVRRAWESRNLVLMVREDGGEGRESNPPPTAKAGVTVLKTGRATGPDPSPRGRRTRTTSSID